MSCIREYCYNCAPENGPCLCSLCSCGQRHVCVDCVNRHFGDEMLKSVSVYCTQCQKVTNYWYDLKVNEKEFDGFEMILLSNKLPTL